MNDKRRLFDFEKFSLFLLWPAPLDILNGLVLEESFLNIKKQSKNIGYKVGLGGEVLISEILDNVHTLELNYLPNSSIVSTLNAIRSAKTQFGIIIQNNSAPKYKGISSECRFMDTPDISIGTDGFHDTKFNILMTDYIGIYLPA